jgi:hypothetical protein
VDATRISGRIQDQIHVKRSKKRPDSDKSISGAPETVQGTAEGRGHFHVKIEKKLRRKRA